MIKLNIKLSFKICSNDEKNRNETEIEEIVAVLLHDTPIDQCMWL